MPSYFNSATGFATTVPGDVSVGDDLTVTDDATVADQLLLTEAAGNHAATPTLAFGDGDTGLYESADDTLNIVSEGVAVAQVNTGDQLVLLESPGNHAAAPTLAFGDGDTGFYEISDDLIAVTCSGAVRFQVATTALVNSVAMYHQAVSSPAALTGDVTDYATGNIVVLRVDPGAAGRTINSLASPVSGKVLMVLNISATQPLTLRHDDGATGTAAQRIYCPNNVSVVIPPNGSRLLWYDGTSSRWRVFGAVA